MSETIIQILTHEELAVALGEYVRIKLNLPKDMVYSVSYIIRSLDSAIDSVKVTMKEIP